MAANKWWKKTEANHTFERKMFPHSYLRFHRYHSNRRKNNERSAHRRAALTIGFHANAAKYNSEKKGQ